MNFIERIADFVDPFSSLAKYLGLSGVIIGFVFYVFKEIIRKNIFPTLTKIQAYSTIRLIIICSTIIAIIGFTIPALKSDKDSQKNYVLKEDSLKYEPVILEKKDILLVDTNKKK